MTYTNEKIIEAVRGAGQIILGAPEKCPGELIHKKGGTFNYVTEYDVAVQDYLQDRLGKLVPGASFCAEEAEGFTGPGEGYTFIIDPIDGTSNFIHGFRLSAVSVSLLYNGRAVSGAVYLPYTDEMFYAEQGGGGLFMTSVDVRRCGAAAADLCFVACGRAAAFCEMLLSPWDYAAGALIVAEAGGVVSRFDGSPLSYTEKCTVVAGNPEAYAQVSAICGKIRDKYSVN